MKRFTNILLMSFITLLMLSLPVLAQRGGGGDRGGRGRGGGAGGSDFRARILERIDANGNGVIEPNEAQGRAGEFVSRMARDAGMQPGQPLPISRLTGSGSGDNRSRDNGQNNDNKQKQPQDDEYPTVPRFGDETIAGFGLSPLTLAGKIVDLEKKYDRRTIENVERTLDRYDKNKNGILDHSEWSAVQWRSDPRDSDLDKDGILTKAEMVERFAKREQGEQRSREERRGRGGGDERSRGGGGEREGGRAEGGRGRGGFGGRGGFDPTMLLAQMDRNKDGKIGPDEVDERRRGWIQSRFQIDMSKPIAIDDIRKRFQAAQEGRDASSRDGRRQSGEAEDDQPKEAYKVDGSSRLKGRLSYRSQGRTLPSQLPDWWDDRDEDADGQVTLREFADRRGDDSIREFNDYDLNNDGLITTNEAVVIEAE